jgi:antitoxin (DNA-binding transcriptional repressor) of toxin-antitoxin stability system
VKRIAVEELPKSLTRVLREVAREPIAIKRSGKVYAALVPLDELDYETFSLGRNARFAEIVKRSRDSARRHGLISLESLEKELGLPPRRRKRAAAKRR